MREGRHTTVKSIGWSVSSKIASFALKFISVPILARYLDPDEFGVVAAGMIVVTFLLMFAGAGLTAGLIRDAVEDQLGDDTVFWTNLAVSLILAAAVALAAGPLAVLLGAEEADWLLRVLSPLFVLHLLPDVASARIARRMAFDKEALVTVIAEVLGSLAAIAAVIGGLGVWALIVQLYVSAISRAIGLFIAARYVPRRRFSRPHIRRYLRFGVPLAGADFVNFISFQSPIVIATRMLGLSAAGTYNLTNRLSDLPNQIVLTGLMSVLFPFFSRMNEYRDEQAQTLSRATQATTLLLAPMLFGLWAVSDPAIRVVFGDRWAFAAQVLGLLAIAKGIMSPCGSFIPYLKATGQAAVLWWFGLARAITVVGAMIVGARLGGLEGLLSALCIANLFVMLSYLTIVTRVAKLPFGQSLADALVPLLLAGAMAILVRLLLTNLEAAVTGQFARLLIGVAVGAGLYGILLLAFRRSLLLSMLPGR